MHAVARAVQSVRYPPTEAVLLRLERESPERPNWSMGCTPSSTSWRSFTLAVEAGYGAQPPGDRRRCATFGLELSSEGLDVAAADLEQPEVTRFAEGDELAQIEGVGVAGEPR
jgi:hypothetical protein